MPKVSQGQQRPADATGNTIHSAMILIKEGPQEITRAQPAKRNSGLAGARSTALEDHKAMAQKAAVARWN